MVKAYATTLILALVALAVVIIGGLLATSTGRDRIDPGERIGVGGKAVIGAAIGFGMGGLSAEFSPLALDWTVSLAIAVVAAALAVVWVRLAVRQAEDR
jgi:hypothetical protein